MNTTKPLRSKPNAFRGKWRFKPPERPAPPPEIVGGQLKIYSDNRILEEK